jgi:hypothetical protein
MNGSENIRPKFMRVAAFSAYSGLTIDRIYKLARDDKIKLVRLGGSTLVDVDQAMGFLESLPGWKEAPPPYWAGSKKPPKFRRREKEAQRRVKAAE